MTEQIAATPGWVDEALERIFADQPQIGNARDAFASCLARSKAPGAPSDMLGAEFEPCHAAVRRAMLQAGIDRAAINTIMSQLETLEAEIAADS